MTDISNSLQVETSSDTSDTPSKEDIAQKIPPGTLEALPSGLSASKRSDSTGAGPVRCFTDWRLKQGLANEQHFKVLCIWSFPIPI